IDKVLLQYSERFVDSQTENSISNIKRKSFQKNPYKELECIIKQSIEKSTEKPEEETENIIETENEEKFGYIFI
ncbi:hypothetical protein A3Q56_06614, partial [Intoshia linei]